jgi:hypothetical protein
MMMTQFSVTTPSPAKALMMLRKAAEVEEAESVETKADGTEPQPPTSTATNPPSATGKNVVLPIGLGAGAALAGGIGVGQGYWEFTPKLIKNETTPVAEVTLEQAFEQVLKNPSLKEKAQNEMQEAIAQLAADALSEAIGDRETALKSIKARIAEDGLSTFLNKFKEEVEQMSPNIDKAIESLSQPFPAKTLAVSTELQSKIDALNEVRRKLLNASPTDSDYTTLQKHYLALTKFSDPDSPEFNKDNLVYLLTHTKNTPFSSERLVELNLIDSVYDDSSTGFYGEQQRYTLNRLEAVINNDNSLQADAKQDLLDQLTKSKKDPNYVSVPLWNYERKVMEDGRLLPVNADYEALKQIADDVRPRRIKYYTQSLDSMKKFLSSIDPLLKDSPTVKNLVQETLKTATQQVDGFMKWGYAKAEDLKFIGGDELVKHANASKIALGAGAVVAGLGTGAMAYALINTPKPTTTQATAE